MTQPAAPHRSISTLPPASASGSGGLPPALRAAGRASMQTRLRGMRTALLVPVAALTVAVIFMIQNVHVANISFLGVHLVLPLAGALLLAAIAGSLLTLAAGPARITELRQIMRRGLRKTPGPAKHPPLIAAAPLQGKCVGPTQVHRRLLPVSSRVTQHRPAHPTD